RWRSACAGTVVRAVAALFVGSGSDWSLLAVAVSTSVPEALGRTRTTMVAVSIWPLERVATVQVTGLLPAQAPGLAVADTSCTPPGSASVSTTLVADAGPRFTTVSV